MSGQLDRPGPNSLANLFTQMACEALCGECPAIWISSARSWGFPTLQLMSSAFAAQPTEATCPGTIFGRLQHGGRQYFLQLTCFEYQTASCQRLNHTTCGWCSGCLVLFAFWHCNGWPHCNPHGADHVDLRSMAPVCIMGCPMVVDGCRSLGRPSGNDGLPHAIAQSCPSPGSPQAFANSDSSGNSICLKSQILFLQNSLV